MFCHCSRQHLVEHIQFEKLPHRSRWWEILCIQQRTRVLFKLLFSVFNSLHNRVQSSGKRSTFFDTISVLRKKSISFRTGIKHGTYVYTYPLTSTPGQVRSRKDRKLWFATFVLTKRCGSQPQYAGRLVHCHILFILKTSILPLAMQVTHIFHPAAEKSLPQVTLLCIYAHGDTKCLCTWWCIACSFDSIHRLSS